MDDNVIEDDGYYTPKERQQLLRTQHQKHPLVRCEDPADPARCQGSVSHGQCPFKCPPGKRYCSIHGHDVRGQAKRDANLYRLGQWQARVQELAGHEKYKTLTDELGIMRMLLEQKVQSITTPAEAMVASGSLSELIMKVEKLVHSAHKLDQSMGNLIDKNAVIQIADRIVGAIMDVIPEEYMEAVYSKVSEAVNDFTPGVPSPK